MGTQNSPKSGKNEKNPHFGGPLGRGGCQAGFLADKFEYRFLFPINLTGEHPMQLTYQLSIFNHLPVMTGFSTVVYTAVL